MPKLDIEKSLTVDASEAFTKLKNFLETDPDLRKMDSAYQCTFDDSQKSGEAKGKQFKATLRVEPAGSGSKVAIGVDLPFLLTPLKGTIEASLRKKLDRLFA
jgi:hypothetical protein